MREYEESSAQLLSHAKGAVKQYLEFEVGGAERALAVYTTFRTAAVGSKCAVTRYKYKTPTTSVISARMEDLAIWTQAMEDYVQELYS